MRLFHWATGTMTVLVTSVAAASAPTPWERYLSQPAPDSARQVSNIAYSERGVGPEHVHDDLELLAVQVASSDEEAVRLAFRLRSTADGHLGETIDVMLGRLIRVNARLFLSILRDQHHPVARLDSLVGNFGAAYVDRDAARRYEAARRRDALRAVTDRDLASVRDECLVALKDDGQ